jgi:ABC-type lipoprotein release transport system permease subunit
MKTILKLAWRNLWRNKRRTAITIASVFFGVFFSVLMSSVQQGSMNNMLENLVRFYSGYLQIQDKDFRDVRTVNNVLDYNDSLDSLLSYNKYITHHTQRIESFALASSGERSRGAAILGIQPAQENRISNISQWVDTGAYLQADARGVMLGNDLASYLNLSLHDTLILLGQGYHGTTAAGKYRIHALLDFPLQEMNNNLVYMSLESCRELFSIPGKSTSVVIMLNDRKHTDRVKTQIGNALKDDLKVYSWYELLEEMQNFVEGKLAGGKIIKGVLFMVIGFGILGTVIMLMAERKREFGIMVALGTKKTVLTAMLFAESVLFGILGILSGLIVSFPLVFYFFLHPIRVTGEIEETYKSMGFEPVLVFSASPEIFYGPAITVLILFGVIFLYPVWHLKKLKTSNALRA